MDHCDECGVEIPEGDMTYPSDFGEVCRECHKKARDRAIRLMGRAFADLVRRQAAKCKPSA